MRKGAAVTRRPSHRELDNKLGAAGRLLEADCWAPADPSKLGADFERLGLILQAEQKEALRAAAELIAP